MSPIAVLLLLISAFSHAGWNLLSKNRCSGAFFLIGNTLAVLCMLPLLWIFRSQISIIPLSVWGLLLGTGFFMALYYLCLAGAYRTGDMSMAYPLIRSSPILVVTFVTFVLGRGHEIGPLAYAGIILVVSGCFLLPITHFRNFNIRNYRSLCCLLAFIAAIGTAGYTIIDDRALSILRNLPDSPFNPYSAAIVYVVFEAISSSLWLAGGVLLIGGERRKLQGFRRDDIKRAWITGLGIYLTYGMVLASMAFVENVSYVAAFRQISILIGAILGFTILHEPRYLPKIAGIVIVFIGLVLVGIG